MQEVPKPPIAPLLELAAGQLEVAVQNAEAQAESLAEAVGELTALASALRAPAPPADVAAHGARIAEQAERALIAMQFHDQLAQRILHVRDVLNWTQQSLTKDDGRDWPRLLASIRSRYTMEDERRLFDIVIGEPANVSMNHDNKEALRGSVELF